MTCILLSALHILFFNCLKILYKSSRKSNGEKVSLYFKLTKKVDGLILYLSSFLLILIVCVRRRQKIEAQLKINVKFRYTNFYCAFKTFTAQKAKIKTEACIRLI